jgi:iron-sulfur cluster repair protein YtfE (RIC family)
MNLKQDGLTRRLAIEARRIASQHRQLDELYGLLLSALDGEPLAVVLRGFERFRDALEAHFAMEDDVHFPAFHGLRPDLESRLTALIEEHKVMRQVLDDVQDCFKGGDLEKGAKYLDALVVRLARHEEIEEQLIGGLSKPL